jgi:NADH-quinone oxidoreductase subunit E
MKNPIMALQDAQNAHGYLSKATLQAISKNLDLPLSKVYGIATFYHQFRLKPVGEYVIYICKGTACHAKGKETFSQYLRELLGLQEGESTTDDGLFTVEYARCFGCCSLAPVIMIADRRGFSSQIYGHLTPAKLKKILKDYKTKHLAIPQRVL